MITEVLPCDKEEALLLLGEVEDWLVTRARLTLVIGGIAILVSIVFSTLGPLELEAMGALSTILLIIIVVWLYRGNRDLERKIRDFRIGVERGLVNLEDYCDLAVVAAVVAYQLKRVGGNVPSKGSSQWDRT